MEGSPDGLGGHAHGAELCLSCFRRWKYYLNAAGGMAWHGVLPSTQVCSPFPSSGYRLVMM
ncbi:hypothetical protein MUK42_01794 [Musa troglodytarum]|uniref:Uncharacterized protein n=1 Tax=Musa troglodytarum TaxID=320322 RepID=A0A9E7FE70_9LILI|nr:hypothetical protein MUK42_01794 [Musa troglodytarum]